MGLSIRDHQEAKRVKNIVENMKHRKWIVCPYKTCFLTEEKRKAGKCEFAILNKAGNPDCGYG